MSDKKKCSLCTFTCISDTGLTYHVNSKHSNQNQKRHQCCYCSYSSKFEGDVKYHVWMVHNTVRE